MNVLWVKAGTDAAHPGFLQLAAIDNHLVAIIRKVLLTMDGALLPSDGSLSNLLQGESSRGGMERTDSEASAGWRSLFVDVPDWIASTVQSPGRAAAPAAEQLSQVTPEKVGAPSRGRSRVRRSSSGESADSKAEPLLSNVQPV